MVKKLFNFLFHRCSKHGHSFIFKQAWEASYFIYKDGDGSIKSILLASSEDPILDEDLLKDLLAENYTNTRYLINLECKYCGHRVSIEDALYNPKYSA